MTQFTVRGIQLALQIGHRAGLGRRRSPPSDGGDQLSPRIKEVGVDAQLLPNHRSGLAAVEPVQDRFAFEGFVEFPALSDRCLFHWFGLSLFTQFSVHQFEATSGWASKNTNVYAGPYGFTGVHPWEPPPSPLLILLFIFLPIPHPH